MSKYYSSSIAFGANQTKTEKVVVNQNKIGDVTTDAVSGALTVDEVPTLNSLNPVSSDGVARAVIQAGAELPTRGSEDTGKVLTVANSDGDLEWDEPAEELPDMTGQDGKILGAVDNAGTMTAQWVTPPESYPSVADNAGKVLTVNSGATGVEWASTQLPEEKSLESTNNTINITEGATSVSIDVANPLPASTSADENKVLTVNASGNAEWATPATPSVDEVPTVESTDDGKVLTASYSGGVGSYSWETAQGGGSSLPSTTGNAYKVLSVNSDASATEWVLPLRKTNYTATYDSTRKIYTLSLANSSYPLYGVEGYFLATIVINGSGTSINNLWLLINESQYDDAETHNIDSFYWNKAIPVFSGSVTLSSSQKIQVVTELLIKKKSSGQVKVHLALSTSPNISDAISSPSLAYSVAARLMEKI